MASAKATIDHDEIRRWVEARGGFPAHVVRTGQRNDPGVLRIDYPGFSGGDSLQRIDWDQWFEWFDRDNLAFLYQDESRSRFSKLVDRSTVDVSGGTRRAGRSRSSKSGARGGTKAKKASSSKSRSGGTKRAATSAASKRSTKSSKTRPAKRSASKATAARKSGAKKAASSKSTRSSKTSASRSSKSSKRSSASTSASKGGSRKTAKRSSSRATSARSTAASRKTTSRTSRPAAKKSPARAKKSSTRTAKKSSARTTRSRTSGSGLRTTDHDEIRQWVEQRGGYPARVKRTGRKNDPGILRIDYPGFSGGKTLERIDWDQWFDWFDRDKLAFLYQDKRNSRFSKLVRR